MFTNREHGMDLEVDKAFIRTSTKPTQSNQTVCKKLWLILLIIDVVLVVVLAGSFIIKASTANDNDTELPQKVGLSHKTDDRDMVCIPCDFLGDEVSVNDTLYDLIVTTDCDRKLCCLNNGGEVQQLILQMILNESNGMFLPIPDSSPTTGLSWWRDRPSSAHVYGIMGTDGELVPEWKNDESRVTSFVNDLVFENNSFHLTKHEDNGVYFIYSAVTFDIRAAKSLPFGFHQIVKMNKIITRKGKPIEYPLQMNKFGGSPMTSQWHTSFLCGTVKLQKYEFIKARIDEGISKYLDRRQYSNFFGMYKL